MSSLTCPPKHGILEAAFGCKETHLDYFEVIGERFGPRELEMRTLHEDGTVCLAGVLREAGAWGTYVYDLGDFWRHRVEPLAIEPDFAGHRTGRG